MSIWYGNDVADETELRLCGDLSGKRVIELGIAPRSNALAMAALGAKAIAVDTSGERIAALRSAAEVAELRVECHRAELAELGMVASTSVDVVISAHSIGGVDDVPRLLRQVHRVLRPGASFIVAMRHPVAAMFDGDDPGRPAQPYGGAGLTIGELYMSFERSNFHADVIHELNDRRTRQPLAPSVLVVRARKQGV